MSKASVYLTVDGIDVKHSVKEINRALDALPGVLSVSVGDGSGQVAVDFDTTGVESGAIGVQLEKMGYRVLRSRSEVHIM